MPRKRLVKPKAQAQADFIRFARGQWETHDHFPHVKVFSWVADKFKLPSEQRLWLLLLYMAYYHDGSAWYAFTRPGVKQRKVLPPVDLPITPSRRNLFGGRIEQHFRAWMAVPSLTEYLCDVADWKELISRLLGIYGNGRWAAYTTGEILCESGAVSVIPDDYMIAGSTGPAEALEMLGLPPTEASAVAIDRLLRRHGIRAKPEQVESFLCNWSRVVKGDFYLGRNHDRQQSGILKVERLKGVRMQPLWDARAALFPPNVLGEVGGWAGVDKQRTGAYVATGKVLGPRGDDQPQ